VRGGRSLEPKFPKERFLGKAGEVGPGIRKQQVYSVMIHVPADPAITVFSCLLNF
jgi:hypothetical protein